MIRVLLLVAGAYVLMEPATYLAHRFVMHGLGRRLHRAHHRNWPTRRDDGFFEANDAFPVVFASITLLGFAVGFNVDGWSALLPIGVGISLYGASYAYVHDVYIHERLGPRRRRAWLDRLAEAHDLHHRYGGEPYGMLVPVVPSELRERAARRVDAVPGP